jgi:hypothetical protein
MNLHSLLAGTPPGFAVPWARCRVRSCRAPLRADGNGCTAAVPHPVTPPTCRLYSTWTSTRINLAEMHARGMRLLTGPDQLTRYEREVPPLSYAMDNGAWGCFQRGEPFAPDPFRRALAKWGEAADWIALPDIVNGGPASLALSASWIDEVRPVGRPMLIPVQDGMTADDLRPFVARGIGIFVGGLTAWKESSLPMWGALKRETGCYLHVGRVNSGRRVQLAIDAGADSTDGTTLTQYSVNAPKMDGASRCEARESLFEAVSP